MTSFLPLARLLCVSLVALSGVSLAAQQVQEPEPDRRAANDSPLADYERTRIAEVAVSADGDFTPQTRRPSVLPGATGQPRLDPLLERDPLARLSTRIENRIPNRLQTRLDRNYGSSTNPASSYASAQAQTRKRQAPRR